MILWESTTAYIDLATALYPWLSLKLLLARHEAQKAGGSADNGRAYLLPSALLMGFALGTKYTALGFWGMTLVGLFVAELLQERRVTGAVLGTVAFWGVVALAVGAPWYIKNIMFTGNPVYPFAYEIFGGKYWSLENAKQYAEEQKRFGLGRDALNLLLAPWNVTMELTVPRPKDRAFIYTEYGIFALSPVFIGLLLLAPFLKSRLSLFSRISLLYGLGVFLFWFFVMQQTRYLIPALPAFAVVGAEVLWLLWAEERKIVARAGGALVAAGAVWGLFLGSALAFTGGLGINPAWPVVSGQQEVNAYVNRTFALGPASDWINAHTPKDAKVALFEVRGLYLDREYLWAQPDHAEGLIPWNAYRDVDDWLADFRQRGLTTILLGVKLDENDGRRWRGLLTEAIAQNKVQLVFESPGPGYPIRVYRIP